jgi:hypothetical protein
MADNKDHTQKESKVLACSCKHEYQDQRYGQGNRLMNPTKDGYICTVCGGKRLKS